MGGFLTAEEAKMNFGLLEGEVGAWEATIRLVQDTWRDLLHLRPAPCYGEWIAVFADNNATEPMLVCLTGETLHPHLGPSIHNIPLDVPVYTVKELSGSLMEIPVSLKLDTMVYDRRGGNGVTKVVGCVRRVRVVEVKRGPKKTSILLYYGRIIDLESDPHRLQWNKDTTFMSYTSNLGHKLLLKRHPVPSVVERKSAVTLPVTVLQAGGKRKQDYCRQSGIVGSQ